MIFSRAAPKLQSSVIAIIGMHRSGTSCLAGSLQQKGLYLGEVHEWNEHNRKGNRENEAIAQLNEDVLSYSGGSWHQPPRQIKWKRSHSKRRNQIIEQFEAKQHSVWGFKDTRVTLVREFWQDAIPELQFVATFRHPLLVARSLNKRDNMPLEYALKLWLAYNEQVLMLHRQQAFPVISFDAEQDAYIAAATRIATELQLPEPTGNAFLDKALKTATTDGDDIQLSERILAVYGELQEACQ